MKQQELRRAEYPVIEKTMPISPEELIRIRRTMIISERVQESILDLLISAQRELVDTEQQTWDYLAKKMGLGSLAEVQKAGKMLEIDWVTSQANLRARK